jgi:hypothetical protein
LNFSKISRLQPATLTKEAIILDSLEEDLLVDFLELKGIVGAPLSAAVDAGAKTSVMFKMHMHRKAPWLLDYMEEYTSGGSRKEAPQASNDSQEAERLIALWKQMQEEKSKAK